MSYRNTQRHSLSVVNDTTHNAHLLSFVWRHVTEGKSSRWSGLKKKYIIQSLREYTWDSEGSAKQPRKGLLTVLNYLTLPSPHGIVLLLQLTKCTASTGSVPMFPQIYVPNFTVGSCLTWATTSCRNWARVSPNPSHINLTLTLTLSAMFFTYYCGKKNTH